jgi:uncharacterized protein (TIGR00251 family)
VVIDVRVVTRAGHAGIAGCRDRALLVRLNAPPVDGRANAELVALLAQTFAVPKHAVAITSGERSRRKRVHITGITAEVALARLAPVATAQGPTTA